MVTLIKYGALSGGEKYNVNALSLDGLSTDTKPIRTYIEYGSDGREVGRMGIPNGSIFTEIDTGDTYMYDADNITWHKVSIGGEGGGFTPTETQLTAMNSGITTEDVAQIATNENNISSVQNVLSQTYNSADCNMSLYLMQDDGSNQGTYYDTSMSRMKFVVSMSKNQYKYWDNGIEKYKYKYVSVGLIVTDNASKARELTLSIPPVVNETYITIFDYSGADEDDGSNDNKSYTWLRGFVNIGDIWYIRPHLEFVDLETNVSYTMYGAVYKVTVGVPCTIECDTLSCTELTAMEKQNENNILSIQQTIGDINSVLEEVL